MWKRWTRWARWAGLCTVTCGALALSSGCRKKTPGSENQSESNGKAQSMSPTADSRVRPDPRRGAAVRRAGAPRPGEGAAARRRAARAETGASAGSVPPLTGPDAPPAVAAKALGEAPKLMARAHLSDWMRSPLTRPLVAMSQKGIRQALEGCADKFPIDQLKKALFLQSAGQLIRRAEDAAQDSHYIVMSAGFDVPAVLGCLARAKTFRKVRLNGAVAYQPKRKPGKRAGPKAAGRKAAAPGKAQREAGAGKPPSWWFAPARDRLVIVDGPWAKKVTPGKGPLGRGDLLKHVGEEALRVWAKDFAPDIPAVVAYLKLTEPVVARADVTWRDEKDAQAMKELPAKAKGISPKLAELMKPMRITVQGRVSTFALRVSPTRALAMAKVVQMFFVGGRKSAAPEADQRSPAARNPVTRRPAARAATPPQVERPRPAMR